MKMVGRSRSFVLVIDPLGVLGRRGNGPARFFQQLHGLLVHADDGNSRIVRPSVGPWSCVAGSQARPPQRLPSICCCETRHWRVNAKRPPSEVSQFTTSYLAMRAPFAVSCFKHNPNRTLFRLL